MKLMKQNLKIIYQRLKSTYFNILDITLFNESKKIFTLKSRRKS